MKVLVCVLVSLTCMCAAEPVCDTKDTWRKMLLAKDKHGTLAHVQIAAIIESHIWWQALSRHRLEHVVFYKLPNFVWGWYDPGTKMFPRAVYTYDVNENTVAEVSEINQRADASKRLQRPMWQLPVLLMRAGESEPLPLSCNVSNGGIAIVTSFLGNEYTFHVRRDESVPHLVEEKVAATGEIIDHFLRNYEVIDGVLVPTKHKQRWRAAARLPTVEFDVSYEFNPAYDHSLLDRSPSLEAGPNAWRRRTK